MRPPLALVSPYCAGLLMLGMSMTSCSETSMCCPAPVAPRPALAERRDRTEHDAGIALALRVVTDAELGERAGHASLDHRVGALAQIEKQLAAARLLEVEGDAALAGVLCQPRQRALGIGESVPEGPALAQRMAAGRLDLNHVRTEITEQSAGQQP